MIVALALALGLAFSSSEAPYLIVLGVAQDGGAPQAGDKDHPGWEDPRFRRYTVCLGLVDPSASQRWMFEATPDFKNQLQLLDRNFPVRGVPGLQGIFLTHAHMGHYVGLVHLGHEAMGASAVPVYAMPRMSRFLAGNGPWDQLVRYRNIELRPLADGQAVGLNERIRVTPFLVPHRQEYSEVVGFRIQGPNRAAVFIPDIDSWREWDDQGVHLEDVIESVSVAYLDGSFFANGEIPGRDMSTFPHPFITTTMKRLSKLPAEQKAKVRFIHLNHTNPALRPDSEARKRIEAAGFRVAERLEIVGL